MSRPGSLRTLGVLGRHVTFSLLPAMRPERTWRMGYWARVSGGPCHRVPLHGPNKGNPAAAHHCSDEISALFSRLVAKCNIGLTVDGWQKFEKLGSPISSDPGSIRTPGGCHHRDDLRDGEGRFGTEPKAHKESPDRGPIDQYRGFMDCNNVVE